MQRTVISCLENRTSGRLRRSAALAALTFVCFACSQPAHEVKAGDRFALTVPGYLDAVDSLHSRAALQFENARREVYVIAIDQARAELNKPEDPKKLDAFLNISAAAYEELLIDRALKDLGAVEIASLKGLQREATGRLRRNNAPVTLTFTALESKERFYFIATWTLTENLRRYGADLAAIPKSFREL